MCAACDVQEMAVDVRLTAREQTHLVRLVTDRPEQLLRIDDQGIEKRVMNSLVVKGMASSVSDERGRVQAWQLTAEGLERSKSIY